MKKNAAKVVPSKSLAGITTVIVLICLSFSICSYAQPPCNGVPQTGNIIAFQNPVCPGVNFILLYNPTESGITYQWLSSPDGNNYNPIPGAVQQQLFTSILQPTYFELRITCTQSGQSQTTQPILINVILPVIQYPTATVVLNDGESTHPDNTGYVTFTTECCLGSVTYSDATSSNCCQIVITRTWTIVDCHGEGLQYVQTITVLLDVAAPVITCTPLGAGACNTTPTPDPGSVTVTDECPGTLSVATSEAAGPGCIVVTTFTWTATDQCGHSSTCTQTYSRIMDAIPPVIVCPAPVALPCNTTPTPSVGLISATDNCGTPEIGLLSSSSSTTGCLVTYVFTWRAIDACGNFADCDQIITSIHDAVAPVITCPDVIFWECNLSPSSNMNIIATDNCGTPVVTFVGSSSVTFGCDVSYLFTWKATDACGNSAVCSQVQNSHYDETPPVITCPGPTSLPCNTTPTPSVGLISATDNCGGSEIVLHGSSLSTSGCLVTYVFTWKAIDDCGHSAYCDQILTSVHDLIPPVILCPGPFALPCNTTPTPSASLISATDNCGTPAISLLGTSSSTVGCTTTFVFSWRATDACGNFADCDQILTSIFDEIPPTILCPPPVALPCNTTPVASSAGILTQDNCGIPTLLNTGVTVTTVGCLKTFVFTWQATDACGNFAVCDEIFTSVFDNIDPFIECPEPFLLPCNTTPVADPSSITVADNCGTPDLSLISTDITNIECLRVFELTWRATDDCGNFSECTQVYFSDFDIIPPEIICPDPDTLCNVTPTPSVSQISATDNCGIVDIVLLGTSASTAGCVTTHNFTWKATDDCGNISTCVQIIYAINDLIDPEIIDCPNSHSLPNDEGLCGAFVSWIPPTATDDCGLLSFTSTHAPNSFFEVGTTTVTYTAIDLCGHIKTCSFIITVDDLEPPWNMNCPGVIIQDNDPGLCSAVVNWNVTASDNCGILSIVSVPASGSVFLVGVTPVLVTATDVNGNTWTCAFNVHVNDTEKPIFLNCPENIIKFNDAGDCFADVDWPFVQVTDNCEIATLTTDEPFGDFPIGITTVTYTATDIYGNVKKCSFTVTVIDNEKPVIQNCPANITVDNDVTLCKAEVTWIEPTATDNCALFSIFRSHAPGSDFIVGTTIVTYIFTDIYGNFSVCTFNVKVNDNEDPFILSTDIVTCDTVVFFNFIIGDNCLIDEFSYSPPSGSVFQPGTTTQVYVEAWDIYDNFNFKFFNVTVLVPPSEIDSVILSSSEICLGDSITFTVYYDTLGTGGVVKLYDEFCATEITGANKEVDTAWEIKAGPNAAGNYNYNIRIEGYCDTTECFPVSFIVNPCPVVLNANIILEGHYLGSGLMINCLNLTGGSTNPLDADSIFISAMDPAPPYAVVDRQPGILKTNGDATVTFDPAVIANNFYYLKINHRNSLETWSKNPVQLTNPCTYLFSSAATQAFADNQVATFDNLGYAIYTGDINQDKTVDATDFLVLDPEIQAGLFGYYLGDLNGDGAVDASDFLTLDPNIQLGIGAATP